MVIVDLCKSTERAFLSLAEPGVVPGVWGEKLGPSLNGWVSLVNGQGKERTQRQALDTFWVTCCIAVTGVSGFNVISNRL